MAVVGVFVDLGISVNWLLNYGIRGAGIGIGVTRGIALSLVRSCASLIGSARIVVAGVGCREAAIFHEG